jgi:hypothetical protein
MSGEKGKGYAAAALTFCAGGLALCLVFVLVGLVSERAARAVAWASGRHPREFWATAAGMALLAALFRPAREGLARFARWRLYRRVDRRIKRERDAELQRRASAWGGPYRGGWQ